MKGKTIALIAHDRRKQDMTEWVKYNVENLVENHLVCTGTTGTLIEDTLLESFSEDPRYISLQKMNSGPMGGDAQIAAMVVEGKIDFCVFLIDDVTVFVGFNLTV